MKEMGNGNFTQLDDKNYDVWELKLGPNFKGKEFYL
jgi:hypothetical protein